MLELVNVALSNAVVATLLALVIFPLARWSKCCKCGHVLWIIVLLKLITPPLVVLPVPLLPPQVTLGVSTEESDSAVQTLAVVGSDNAGNAGKTMHQLGDVSAASPSLRTEMTPSVVLLTIWGIGSVIYGLYQLYVTVQMGRLMRLATPHPRVDRAIHRIARKAKVKNYPTARLVPWIGSPMLWGMGGTSVIVIPKGLFNSINDSAADTLLQHELAHFHRGDQWVRILEAVTSTIFWWHPLVWIAKREIEAFEEQCCDAWVVQHDYANRRRYAEALLDTVDFISEASNPTSMPLAASGLGRVRLLEKRLRNIIQGDVPRLNASRTAALLTLFCLLPLRPSLTEASFIPAKSTLTDENRAVVESANGQAIEGSSDIMRKALHPADKTWESGSLGSRRQGVEYARATAVFGTYQLTASTGHNVSLRHVVSGKNINLREHEITCAAFLPPITSQESGQQFVAGCHSGQVLLFDCGNGEVVRTIANFVGSVRSIAYSAEGLLAVAGQHSAILLIDMEKQDATLLPIPASSVSCVRFSQDGRRLIWVEDTSLQRKSASRVEIWQVDSWQRIESVLCPDAVGVAEFYGANERQGFVTASWDGTLRVWDGQFINLDSVVPKDVVSAAAFSTNAVSLGDLTMLDFNSSTALTGFHSTTYYEE